MVEEYKSSLLNLVEVCPCIYTYVICVMCNDVCMYLRGVPILRIMSINCIQFRIKIFNSSG